MKYCSSCGAANDDSVKFCVACGTRFAAPAPSPAPQPVPQPTPQPAPQPTPQPADSPVSEKPKKKLSAGAVIGIIIAVLAIIAAVVFLVIKPFNSTETETLSTPRGDIEITRSYKKEECTAVSVSDGEHDAVEFELEGHGLEGALNSARFEYDGITVEYVFGGGKLKSYTESSVEGTLEAKYTNGSLTVETLTLADGSSTVKNYTGGELKDETEYAPDGFAVRSTVYDGDTVQESLYYREGEDEYDIVEVTTLTTGGSVAMELTREEGDYPAYTIRYYTGGAETGYVRIDHSDSWVSIYTSRTEGSIDHTCSYYETDFETSMDYYELVSQYAPEGLDSLVAYACDEYEFYLECEYEYAAGTYRTVSAIQYNTDGSVFYKSYYDDNGNETRTEYYDDGEVYKTEIRTYDASGKETSCTTIKSGISLDFNGARKQIGSWIMPVIGASLKNCTSFTFCYEYVFNSGMLGPQELYASINGSWIKLGYFNCDELLEPGSFTYSSTTPFSVEGFVLIPEHRNESSYSVDMWLDDVYTVA